VTMRTLDLEKALERGPSVAATLGGRRKLVSPDSPPETDLQGGGESSRNCPTFINLLLKLH